MDAVTPEPPLVAVVGPTAVGKTAVGIALAERLDGEIISADAVAVYRGLDIGSAKPDASEQARTPFHLIDVADPDEDFTLADFARLAEQTIGDIRRRGKTPIIVGGTGLYVRAVTATLTMPNVPPQTTFREAMWAEVAEKGALALHERLAAIDPEAAAKISPGDAKRIIRALEVHHATGQPMSSFHTPEGVHGISRPNTYLFGLRMDREELYARIEARVDAMLTTGFLEEVRSLLAAGYGPNVKAMQSLGYRHLCAHLVDGVPLAQVIEELKRDTRRYAKRQLTWFNADSRVVWHDLAAGSESKGYNDVTPVLKSGESAPTTAPRAEQAADALAAQLRQLIGRG
jgi:tRNA dimethylallyltransferase